MMSLAEDALSAPRLNAAGLQHKQPPALTKGRLTGKDLPRLTAQQMAFVEELASGKHSQTSAYLEAYPTAKKWPQNAVWASASQTASHPKIRLWLDRAWEAQARHIDRSAKGHVHRLETIAERALDDGVYNAALGAEKAHAEALGHRRNDGEAAVSITIKQYQGDSPVIEHEDERD